MIEAALVYLQRTPDQKHADETAQQFKGQIAADRKPCAFHYGPGLAESADSPEIDDADGKHGFFDGSGHKHTELGQAVGDFDDSDAEAFDQLIFQRNLQDDICQQGGQNDISGQFYHSCKAV